MSVIKFTIPEPCHQNWQEMSIIEQGRFCSSCQKAVTDFSALGDHEIYALLSKGDADMCGRFSEEQMQRGIKYGQEKKRYWGKYFFNFFIPAFLFTKQSSAQGKIVQQTKASCSVGMRKIIVPYRDKHFELSGSIMDSGANKIIGYGTVSIIGGNGAAVSETGTFNLKSKATGPSVILKVTAIGYESREIELAIPANNFSMSDQIIYLKPRVVQLEEVIVHSATNYLGGILGGMSMSVKVNRTIELPKRLITAISDSIRIYPSPVKRGNTFKVALKLKRSGRHGIQVIDITGRIIFQQAIDADVQRFNSEIVCSNAWNAGVYSMRVLSADGRLLSVSRFLIE